MLEAATFKEWVLNLGQRDAAARIAHLLVEFAERRAAALPDEPRRFELPLSQVQLAAATGMTSVHVNRMLKVLESRGALSRYMGRIVIDQLDELKRIARFEPSYLEPRALVA